MRSSRNHESRSPTRQTQKPPSPNRHPNRDAALRLLEIRERAYAVAEAVIEKGLWLDRLLEPVAQDKKLSPPEKRFIRVAGSALVRHKLLLNFLAQKLWPSVKFSGEGFHPEVLAIIPALQPDAIDTSDEEKAATMRSLYGHLSAAKAAEVVSLLGSADIPVATRCSLNAYADEKGAAAYGARWPALAQALNGIPPCFIRHNPFKGTFAALTESLHSCGLNATVVDEQAGILSLPDNNGLFTTEPFLNGLFEVQDWSSQQIAPFAKPAAGLRVLDACAGQGGKTLHLSALMGNKGKIVATDASAERLKQLKKRAARADAQNIEVRENLWAQGPKRISGQFDRVLIDAPCSGSGAWRRNPGLKWSQGPDMLARLITEQTSLLRHYSQGLKQGGYLIYATCSIWPDENRLQIDRFLSEHPNQWEIEDELHLAPDTHLGDGFYAARLKRL